MLKHCENTMFPRFFLFLRERDIYFPGQKKNYENCGWETIFPILAAFRAVNSTCPVSVYQELTAPIQSCFDLDSQSR